MSMYVKLDKVYNGVAQTVDRWADSSPIARTVSNYRGMIRPGCTMTLRFAIDCHGDPMGVAYTGQARTNPEFVLTLRQG